MISGKASKESSEPLTSGEPHEPREKQKESAAGEVLESLCRFQGNARTMRKYWRLFANPHSLNPRGSTHMPKGSDIGVSLGAHVAQPTSLNMPSLVKTMNPHGSTQPKVKLRFNLVKFGRDFS